MLQRLSGVHTPVTFLIADGSLRDYPGLSKCVSTGIQALSKPAATSSKNQKPFVVEYVHNLKQHYKGVKNTLVRKEILTIKNALYIYIFFFSI